MRISDWSSDVCSSDLVSVRLAAQPPAALHPDQKPDAERKRKVAQRTQFVHRRGCVPAPSEPGLMTRFGPMLLPHLAGRPVHLVPADVIGPDVGPMLQDLVGVAFTKEHAVPPIMSQDQEIGKPK